MKNFIKYWQAHDYMLLITLAYGVYLMLTHQTNVAMYVMSFSIAVLVCLVFFVRDVYQKIHKLTKALESVTDLVKLHNDILKESVKQ